MVFLEFKRIRFLFERPFSARGARLQFWLELSRVSIVISVDGPSVAPRQGAPRCNRPIPKFLANLVDRRFLTGPLFFHAFVKVSLWLCACRSEVREPNPDKAISLAPVKRRL